MNGLGSLFLRPYKIIMALLEKQLYTKRSTVPGSGKGLFTRKMINKGERIVEYKGKVTTWKEVDHKKGNNGYIYYIKPSLVIDAYHHPNALARYANDAKGLSKVKGLKNNSNYIEDGDKVYIEAIKNIPAGSEILVDYGKEYWDIIRYNKKIEEQSAKKKVQD